MGTDNTVNKTVYEGSCVGMQFRDKEGILEMIADEDCEVKLSLHAEPDNQYNPDAIAVHYLNHVIGYIPNQQLEETHSFLDWLESVNVTFIESFIKEAKLANGLPVWLEFGIEVEYV